jgi:Holliday junction resolvase
MRFAKTDANQPEIVQALRAAGISVQSTATIGKGFPDLIAAKGDQCWLIEVKMPKGTLTPDQQRFLSEWKGTVHIARTVEDALQIVGVLGFPLEKKLE